MRGYRRVPLLALLGVALLVSHLHALNSNETEAEVFMMETDLKYNEECNKEMTSRWEYITDVFNETKEAAANDAAVEYMNFKGRTAIDALEFDYSEFEDITLYRWFRFVTKQGPGALDSESLIEYKRLQASMETIYSTATICTINNETCGLTLEPDIEHVMATSEDWDELLHFWEQWREVTGKQMRSNYQKFVDLSNEAAVLDGFNDTGSYWLNGYTVDQKEADTFAVSFIDQPKFREMVDAVWTKVSNGLYKKLHAFVRMRLQEVFPGKFDSKGPIPAHILGNMWAQTWSNIARHVMPFPSLPTFDVTDSMKENGWNIDQMFTAAEDFFTSIDLFPMTETFWSESVVNQSAWPTTIVCHASAEDFCLGPMGDDYRIKMCTQVDMEDLVTVHHEMGHIEYFMAYKNLSHLFRDSANPGFHEALGDLISLSVSTPRHLEDILDLTPSNKNAMNSMNTEDTQDSMTSKYSQKDMQDLNFLMKMALDKIAFLPFGYLIDKYRWAVFDGSITPENLNSGWWELRESLQGISPPSVRGEDYFDPGAKYHVPANVPYIRYFVSFIVQFQFHRKLCEGYDGPLHTCDIYNNTEAGETLRNALEKGFSEPWPKVLFELGGSQEMETDAIIEYFQPLIQFLDESLKSADQCEGWGDDCIPSNKTEAEALIAMDQMDLELTEMVQKATEVDWQYFTNASDEAGEASNAAWGEVSKKFKEWHGKTIVKYEDVYEQFKSNSLKRRFRLQKSLGTSALDEENLTKLNQAVTRMTGLFNEKVCDMNEGCEVTYSSDDLVLKMADPATSEEELKYYWIQWREVSGRKMKDDYTDYINLQNKAAKINNFADAGVMWLDPYTEPDLSYTADSFKNEIDLLWNQTQPLYVKLHGYVRYKLAEHYDLEEIDHIPAHLLGNMWAQSWENIYHLVAPFPEVSIPNINEDLAENIDNVQEMFEIAEEFFTSLGLDPMTARFYNESQFTQNDQGTVICHASAWDFYDEANDPEDGRFRIKMCTNKNQEDFIVIHHEMGHTEYQMAYRYPKGERPMVFRTGANPGFHEAIGDTIALSVSTPSHLEKISEYLNSKGQRKRKEKKQELKKETDKEYNCDTIECKQNMNYLMKTALAKITFLPFAYILDHWRWELFANNNEDLNYNQKWWELRLNVQGIAPPVSRFPSSDFDAGSKYHVPTNVPYIRYFVAHILQFQFHEHLCSLLDNPEARTPIFNCDIYESKEAGDALLAMLRRGASVGWHEQLQDFIGSSDMDASALLTYFSPLVEFLDNFTGTHNIEPGWSQDQIGQFMKAEREDIPPTVPIVVGVVLAIMVLVVIIAYFVGRASQKKVAKKAADDTSHTGRTQENIEIAVRPLESKPGLGESSHKDDHQ